MMFKAALVAIVASAVAGTTLAAKISEEQYQYLYTRFLQEFNKSYELNSTFSRYQTFKKNIDLIVAHNARGESWEMGVNQFTDMTTEEFSQMMGFKQQTIEATAAEMLAGTFQNEQQPSSFNNSSTAILTSSPDWTNKFNPIKNQASCGSCYSFSSIGTLEATYNIKHNKLYDLSEQQVVDCSKPYGNQGCQGGLMSNTYNYLKAAKGSCLNSDYPYTGKEGTCHTSCNPAVAVTGYTKVGSGASGLAAGLSNGPIAVALSAGNSAFQMYKSGILAGCSNSRADHAVIAVHYNSNENSIKIRNSWGSSWGESGFIRISTTQGDMCGLGKSGADVQPTL